MRQIEQHNLCRLLKYLAVAAICVLLSVSALCAAEAVRNWFGGFTWKF